jgi:hypothetical protein
MSSREPVSEQREAHTTATDLQSLLTRLDHHIAVLWRARGQLIDEIVRYRSAMGQARVPVAALGATARQYRRELGADGDELTSLASAQWLRRAVRPRPGEGTGTR